MSRLASQQVPGSPPCLCLLSVKITGTDHRADRAFPTQASLLSLCQHFCILLALSQAQGFLGTAFPHFSVSCGSTNLLSGLLLVNPIKQALAGTPFGLLLLQPNSPGCPQGLAPKARLYGWKVLDTGLSPKPSNSVLAQFPTFSHGTLCQVTAQTELSVFSILWFSLGTYMSACP